jgi:hypothetical protein
VFYDLDPLVRAAIFGGIFLGSLGLVLWVWWESSDPGRSHDGSRWAWRIVGSLFVAATVPAVVIGAANLDASKETLLNVLAWVSIGSAGGALVTVLLYSFLRPAVLRPVPPISPEDRHRTELEEDIRRQRQQPPPPRPRPALAYLVVKAGPDQGRQFPVHEVTTVGRGGSCSITLGDGRVSESHAQIKLAGQDFVFTDLESTNGSYLRVEGSERAINRPHRLIDGDELRLGRTVVQFLLARNGRGR